MNSLVTRPSPPKSSPRRKVDPSTSTLVQLCRHVIVDHLERYPPAVFGRCDLAEWEAIVRQKSKANRSGRVAKVSATFLQSVEHENDHLATSAVVDELGWKDCTERRFPRGGLQRPETLNVPWPELVATFQVYGERLKELTSYEKSSNNVAKAQETHPNTKNQAAVLTLVETLNPLPVTVTLLQTTGIGKLVRKASKSMARKDSVASKKLDELLQSWKDVVADTGDAQVSSNHNNDDLQMLEKCSNWRQLYQTLKRREEKRRSSQGQRMRERRANLAKGRPKIVKVRPSTTARQQQILDREPKTAAASSGPRLATVRREAAQARLHGRQRSIAPPQKRSFGASVALTNNNKRRHKVAPTISVRTGSNHVMRVPSSTAAGRNFLQNRPKK